MSKAFATLGMLPKRVPRREGTHPVVKVVKHLNQHTLAGEAIKAKS